MAPNTPKKTVEVVICGAGPVGLTAAALLAARGVEVVVLEQHTGTSNEPKAISIDDEALRVFEQAGIVDRILPVVVPGTGTRYYDRHGDELFHARGTKPFRLGYPFKNPFAQPDLERALASALTEAPNVDLRFGTTVTGFAQYPDRMTVRAVADETELEFDAKYVFGCDGGRSATRLLQGVDMTGRSYGDVWLVVDAVEDPHTERFAMHHGDPARPHVIVPGLDGRCRYEFRLFDGEGTPEAPPSFDLIEKLVSKYRTITPDQVERAVNYRFNAVIADSWMIGRSFLLGDAAHMMPPFAGQGLNSGIRDAANLAWKVADVLAGHLDSSILSTYQEERLPHALATVRMSERLGRIVMTTSPGLAQRRDNAAIRALASEDGRSFLEEMRYRPKQQFDAGLLVTGDCPSIVGVQIGQPLVFDTLAHRIGRLDEILGTGWALIGIDTPEKDWVAVHPIVRTLDPMEAVISTSEYMPRSRRRILVDVDGNLNDELSCYTGRFVLVRPDHVVAAAWRPDHTSGVCAAVASWTPTITETQPLAERAFTHG
ncbi:bifunctional 3-(3-hydroxy-phenyl)propionate/3-hydroxycinnamic acid hydroxylase [Rhodococcus erythropolis]|nr:bifunctional 3-(3-hydroxy-phenyl)propionate/3-hydroxycinnamic acid hydroxylase [Rhodococcus erythropolis]